MAAKAGYRCEARWSKPPDISAGSGLARLRRLPASPRSFKLAPIRVVLGDGNWCQDGYCADWRRRRLLSLQSGDNFAYDRPSRLHAPCNRAAAMSEGLNPIEAGKKLHEHGESDEHDHDKAEGHQGNGTQSRHSRILQICEAVLLALVTLTAAWAGYSASRWSTASRVDLAQSSTLRNLATRADLEAITLRNFDASTFNAWYIAFTLNNPQKEVIAEHRFRPAFRVAFNAWIATDPVHNKHAPPGPTYMPQYKLPQQAKSFALDTAATRKFNAGNDAGNTADNYVRITVFLAAVLFLVGIGTSFKLHGARYALVGLGTVLLILSIVLIAQQPGLPA